MYDYHIDCKDMHRCLDSANVKSKVIEKLKNVLKKYPILVGLKMFLNVDHLDLLMSEAGYFKITYLFIAVSM